MRKGMIFYKKINGIETDRKSEFLYILPYWNKDIIANNSYKKSKEVHWIPWKIKF